MNKIDQQQAAQKLIKKLSRKIASPRKHVAINIEYCKIIMFEQLSGNIILPHGLGLNQATYQQLRKEVNDSVLMHKELDWYKDDWTLIRDRATCCAELFDMQAQERGNLITLLCNYRNKQAAYSQQIAVILATACLTQFHLWKSLGLPDRAQLGELIKHNFPELHALNTENMRWKRFFYHQLCKQGGDYLCRSPSCQECKSYHECFA